MPKDVQRTVEGFEDPDEFFKTPNITQVYPKTPGTVASSKSVVSTVLTKRGRMSALGGGDSDDEIFEENLLIEEEESQDAGSLILPGRS